MLSRALSKQPSLNGRTMCGCLTWQGESIGPQLLVLSESSQVLGRCRIESASALFGLSRPANDGCVYGTWR